MLLIQKYLKERSKFSVSEFRTREERFVKCYEDYETEHMKIAISEKTTDNQNDEDIEEVENTYFDLLNRTNSTLNISQDSPQIVSTSVSPQQIVNTQFSSNN
ncbi:hypothetical protein HHI36_018790 [Cryptolaemus montrouzieri]|uniref:Uncharacterized protein n=1 Tax=Cryptolaemus montrouzieri TaxID=559131 RepID=A0ABD2P1V1_9CUCU